MVRLGILCGKVSHPGEAMINGERVENLEAFLDKLNTAKRRVEKRITMLGGADNSVSEAAKNKTLCIVL